MRLEGRGWTILECKLDVREGIDSVLGVPSLVPGRKPETGDISILEVFSIGTRL